MHDELKKSSGYPIRPDEGPEFAEHVVRPVQPRPHRTDRRDLPRLCDTHDSALLGLNSMSPAFKA